LAKLEMVELAMDPGPTRYVFFDMADLTIPDLLKNLPN